MATAADIFKALGDATRLKITSIILSNGNNLCVGAIAGQLEVSQPAVSQQLKILKNAGLVTAHRMGFHIHYRFREDCLAAAGIDPAGFYKALGIKKMRSRCEHSVDEKMCKPLNE